MDRIKDLFSRLIKLIPAGVNLFTKNNMHVYSGYATLFVVTAAIPFVILIVSVVNLLPGYSVDDAMDILFQIIPDLESFRDLIKTIITDLKDQSGGIVAIVAGATAVWYSSNGIAAIKDGLDQLDSDGQNDGSGGNTTTAMIASAIDLIKGIVKRILFTLMLIILIPAFLVFQILGDSIVDIIWSVLKKIEPEILDTTFDLIDDIFDISSVFVILFAFLVVLLMYTVLPATHKSFRSQLPGAVITCICWVVCTALFAFIIPRFWSAASLYGPLASLFLVLMWLRYMIMILFGGAVLNRTLAEEKNEK